MTKYTDEQVGHRSSRRAAFPSHAERNVALMAFARTGRHAEAEGGRRVPPSLPAPDQNRPHVYLDFVLPGAGPAVRLVVELFEDLAPAVARAFRARCMPGAAPAESFRGAAVIAVTAEYVIAAAPDTGRPAASAPPLAPAAEMPAGRTASSRPMPGHFTRGLVSLATPGGGSGTGRPECAITFDDVALLDDGFDVVGRVAPAGDAALESLAAAAAATVGRPRGAPIVVSSVGVTTGAVAGAPAEVTARIVAAEAEEAARVAAVRAEGPDATAARLAREASTARAVTANAVADGLRRAAAMGGGGDGPPSKRAKPGAAAVGPFSAGLGLGDLSDSSGEDGG